MSRGLKLKQAIGKLTGFHLLPSLLQEKTVVFTFHRVLPKAKFDGLRFQSNLAVSDQGFERFLQNISENFDVIPLSHFIQQQSSGEKINSRPQAIITFDDGWVDNYDYAFPLLQQYRLPASIFLCTDYMETEQSFWWQDIGEVLSSEDLSNSDKERIQSLITHYFSGDPISSLNCFTKTDQFIEILKRDHYDRVPDFSRALFSCSGYQPTNLCLSWQQCKTMSDNGVEFGSHTCSHPRLSLLSPTDLNHQMLSSKSKLQAHDINYVDALCYPYGDYSKQVQQRAAQVYSMAFTTDNGVTRIHPENPHGIPRVHVCEKVATYPNQLNYRILRALWGTS